MTCKHRILIAGTVLGALLVVPLAVSAPKQELAAQRYRSASQLYEDLLQVPRLELGERQYQLVIGAFEKVYLSDPSSGYCDDALLRAAELYHEMFRRFGAEQYRLNAIQKYGFAAREYPHSKHRTKALAMVERLRSEPARPGSAPVLRPTEPEAIPESSLRAALSDTQHEAGSVVQPPKPAPPGTGATAISGIRHHSYPDGTRLVLTMSGPAALKYNTLERPKRLYIDLFQSRLEKALLRDSKVAINDSLLSTARLAQNRSNKARLVLDLKRGVSFDVFWLSDPIRFVLDIRASGAPRPDRTLQALSPQPIEAQAPKAATTTAEGRHSLIRALGLKLDRVLIDAGHGGHDTGAVGPTGLREKDVVLDISQQLGTLLEERLGTEVIYTRQSDVFVPLEERTRIANEQGVDLMLSIHCNAAPSTKVRGIETYYLSLTSDSWELSVASLENATSSRSIHQLGDLVSKIALEEKIGESREFATRVQDRLYAGVAKRSRIRNRGVRKAPFVVLIGAKMPAALAEIGFISNKTDESLMRKSSFRKEVAEHLFDGIAAYAESLGVSPVRRSLSSASSQRD